MARYAVICALVVLLSICGGQRIPDSTDSWSEYATESSSLAYTDVYTDEPNSYTREGPVSPKIKFHCFSDGLFSYPPACTRFIQCSNGRAFVMNCPEGLHFNKRRGVCDYPCASQCSPSIGEECRKLKTNDVCSLPREKGGCRDYVVRYYFDVSESRCKKFMFGGCRGNGNNFKSEKQCMEVCGQGDEDTTTQDSSDVYPTANPWDYRGSQDSTDVPWTSASDDSATEGDWRSHPFWRATEPTEESYSTDIGPSEDSWGHFTTGESSEYTSWGSDSGEPRGQHPSRPPYEDFERFSTDSSSNAYSFKARVMEDFKCRGNGAYRNPDDCASFIWCPLNRAIVVPCPPNTHYSEQRNACVDICLAHCNVSLACSCGWAECHLYSRIDCYEGPDAGPCSDRELRYFYDHERGRCKTFYYGGCHGNTNNFRTLKECQNECQSTLLAGFRCPSYNGYFGHYPDCVSYYHCKRGIPTLKRCPEGMAFHHLRDKCVPEEEAKCVYECREPNAVYPAPKDCHSYINCVNGIPKLERCPRGLAFDINKGNCVLERTTSCTW